MSRPKKYTEVSIPILLKEWDDGSPQEHEKMAIRMKVDYRSLRVLVYRWRKFMELFPTPTKPEDV